jgi:hypothetical protein
MVRSYLNIDLFLAVPALNGVLNDRVMRQILVDDG